MLERTTLNIYRERRDMVRDARTARATHEHWAIQEVIHEGFETMARQLRSLRRKQHRTYREMAKIGALNRDIATVVTGVARGHLLYQIT